MNPARPAESPIKHIVIIVKENHTFDNYFGTFGGGANGAKLQAAPNPPPYDPDHKHQTWMARASDQRYKVQYGAADIQGYYDLAKRFTLCDNYYSEVAGPSTPNHLMLICADAPIINNPQNHYRPSPADAYQLPSLPIELEKRGLTWGNYGGYAFRYIAALANHQGNHGRDVFLRDAQNGTLPTVSWVYGDGKPDLSEHPEQNVTDGMKWTIQMVQAVANGGLWDSVAIFITWDDWGGWYDHVAPKILNSYEYGFRVPMIVISPFAKAHYISHVNHDFGSVLKFVESVFGLPTVGYADTRADDLSDCFDFSQTPLTFQTIPAKLNAEYFLNDKTPPGPPDDD